MNDLHVRRTINLLASGSLSFVIVACGGIAEDGSETSEEDPMTPANPVPTNPVAPRTTSIDVLCDALEECDSATFFSDYDSQQDCRDHFRDYSQDYTDEYGRDCGEAFDEILACMSTVYAQTCSQEATSNRCEDEITQFVTECFQYSDYDYDY